MPGKGKGGGKPGSEESDDDIILDDGINRVNYSSDPEPALTSGVVVYALGGNDHITGTMFEDTIYGGSGNDTIILNGTSGSGRDTAYGEVGDDMLIAGNGSHELDGGDGNDILDARSSDHVGRLIGGDGDDIIYSSDAGTFDHRNAIEPGLGNDTIYGGSGFDYLFYGNLDMSGAADVVVDLAYGITLDGELTAEHGTSTYTIDGTTYVDTIYGIESYIGAHVNLSESMYGDDEFNYFNGREGDDLLVGRGGDDELRGWTGNDHLFGGEGSDTLNLDSNKKDIDKAYFGIEAPLSPYDSGTLSWIDEASNGEAEVDTVLNYSSKDVLVFGNHITVISAIDDYDNDGNMDTILTLVSANEEDSDNYDIIVIDDYTRSVNIEIVESDWVFEA